MAVVANMKIVVTESVAVAVVLMVEEKLAAIVIVVW